MDHPDPVPALVPAIVKAVPVALCLWAAMLTPTAFLLRGQPVGERLHQALRGSLDQLAVTLDLPGATGAAQAS